MSPQERLPKAVGNSSQAISKPSSISAQNDYEDSVAHKK